MTVTIDPSDVRTPQAPTGQKRRIPLRPILFGGLGAAGLIAFTVAAFSFFSDLADPRARTPRRATIAATLPDMRDGIPPLAPTAASTSTGTVFNLPNPQAAEAPREQAAEPAAKPARAEASALGLRRDSEPAAEAPLPAPQVAAEATGSVSKRPDAPPSQDKLPAIQNVSTVATEPKTVALVAPSRTAAPIAPAKSETVRAKAAEPRAYAALPPEPEKVEPAQAVAPATAGTDSPASAAAAAAKPKRKPVQARVAAPKPVAEAAVADDAAPAPPPRAAKPSDDPEIMGVPIPGGPQIRAGWNAMFGGDEN